jgi:hypothetical protein
MFDCPLADPAYVFSPGSRAPAQKYETQKTDRHVKTKRQRRHEMDWGAHRSFGCVKRDDIVVAKRLSSVL